MKAYVIYEEELMISSIKTVGITLDEETARQTIEALEQSPSLQTYRYFYEAIVISNLITPLFEE